MSALARKIFGYRHEHTKILILRLHKKPNYMLDIDKKWKGTFILFKKLPEKHLSRKLLSRKSTMIAIDNNEETYLMKSKILSEHKIMFNLLKESVHYKNTIMRPTNTKVFVTPEEIEILFSRFKSPKTALDCFEAIKKLTYYYLNNNSLNDEICHMVLNASVTKLSELNDQQIQKLMQHLIVINDSLKHLPSYYSFMKKLDEECLKRFFVFDPSQMLLINSVFYQLELCKSNYMWRSLRKLGSKPHKLTSKNLVQFFFFLSLCNVPDLPMFDIQHTLEDRMNHIIGDEIGIIARGYFMNERRISNTLLLKKMLIQIANSVKIMHNSTIGATLKILRYSSQSQCCDLQNQFLFLLKHLQPELARLPLVTLTHIAHTCGSIRTYDRDLIDNILRRMLNEIKLARLKDIERISFLVCTLTPCAEYQSECHEIVNELMQTYQSSRMEEIKLYSKSLLRSLIFLIHKNIYPEELITHVLNPAFIKHIQQNNMNNLTNDILYLNCSVQIEVPNYTGPLLNQKLYTCLIKKYCKHSNVHNRHPNILLRNEIVFLCKEKLGIHPYVDQILPHFNSDDIVFGLDEHDKYIAVEPILSVMPHGSIKRVNDNDLRKIQWKIFIFLTNRFNIQGRDGYISYAHTLFRQLKSIGYTPIPICTDKWEKLVTENEKCNYLKQLIFSKDNYDVIKV